MADLLSQLILFPVIRQELIEFFVIVGLDLSQHGESIGTEVEVHNYHEIVRREKVGV
jgi:hypothetical protein